MSDLIEISWSAGSIDEARKVSRYLVQEKLVACAQIIPWIESIYEWNDVLETTQESKVVLKGLKENLETIKDTILKNSKYEVPEILWRGIEGGNEGYLEWLKNGSDTRKNSNKT